jgi:hypothetical protein
MPGTPSPFDLSGRVAVVTGGNLFLASHAADFVTGVTLPVDGGYSIA